jgi:hypothetical protein
MKVNWSSLKEIKIFHNIYNSKPFTQVIGYSGYILIFIDNEMIIFKPNKEELIFQDKKQIDFISLYENISYINKNDNGLLIATDKANIILCQLNTSDFYIELIYQFNIHQNFINDYEILAYNYDNSILMTLDNSLYQIEIKTIGGVKQIIKNCILEIRYSDEKILNSYKLKNLIVIFSNKAIYTIDLDNGDSETIYQKESFNNYTGLLNDNTVYFIKDENSFQTQNLINRNEKETINFSSKNKIRKLNFLKFLYVGNSFMCIINNTYTELIYLLLGSYKIIHKESILNKNSFIIFVDDMTYVISVNPLQYNLKAKVGILFDDEKKNENNKDSFKINIDNSDLQCLENNFIGHFEKLQSYQRNILKNKNKLKTLILCLKKSSSVDKFVAIVKKIHKFKLKLRIKDFNLIYFKITQIWINKFGSARIIKEYKKIYERYIQNIYKEKVEGLLRLSSNILDRETYNELVNLY